MTPLRGASVRNLLGPVVRATYRVRVTGGHQVPRQAGVLILSTYSGLLDPTILSTNLTRPAAVVVGEGSTPPGWRETLGRIVVTEQTPGKGLRDAVGLLREGHAVVMFPEGCSGTTGDFVAGAAYVQAQTGVPVVPVTVLGSAGARPTDPPRLRSAIDVVIGEPFTPTAVADPAQRAAIMAIAEHMRQHFADHVLLSRSRAGRGADAPATGHNGAL